MIIVNKCKIVSTTLDVILFDFRKLIEKKNSFLLIFKFCIYIKYYNSYYIAN